MYSLSSIKRAEDATWGTVTAVWRSLLLCRVRGCFSRKERALSYAFTHAVYAYKLLWPTKLCYDWGFRCEELSAVCQRKVTKNNVSPRCMYS